jgi:outer membrane protein
MTMPNSPSHDVSRFRRTPGLWRFAAASAAFSLAISAGCARRDRVLGERSLHDTVMAALKREVAEASKTPAPRVASRPFDPKALPIRPEFLPELERISGPSSYAEAWGSGALPMGEDLLGMPQSQAPISLQQTVLLAVQNNLAIQFARLEPAIQESQLTAAEAAFDWSLTARGNANHLDEPRVQQAFTGLPVGPTSDQRHQYSVATGLKRNLWSGGQVALEAEANQNNLATDGLRTNPDPQDNTGLTLRWDQPLLRGAGSDTTLATVRLARNAERDAVAKLKTELIRTITETEQAYWQLVRAQWDLIILQRLLDRGLETSRQIEARQVNEATPSQIADAASNVERRKADVLRAQNAVRAASDRLKVFVNDPAHPIGGESLLVALDRPVEMPLTFSLSDALTQAIAARPEIQQAILSLDDTAIRLLAADNARLPQLDLRLQAKVQGEQNDFGEAFDDMVDRAFVNYLVGLEFEQPLGNRRAEAVYRQRRLERQKAATSLQSTVQQVALEVKRSLRAVDLQYGLIEANRKTRITAAENLRALLIEKELGNQGYTVERLDLELRRQEALAQAERDEIAALTDYYSSIAAYFASIGTALERNQIQFDAPNAPGLVPVK